eukprot:TRINITY_DN1707_c0_g1_i7.p1 TRINITY_DN1707_c0_g1~~TRINITY_DN1707_c0_g1_i7.p1  ORF type:complete len:159 (+),score=6.49 TRINITY_DN1707_c0_g1_i7:52-477(+)
MSPHQVVFGEPYNSADQKNLKKHMEIMEHVRHDVKKRSIAVKVHQSIQYDKNKKESAFATRYRVNVQHLKGPFTVEELKTTFCHADPKQLVNRLAMTTKSTQRHTNDIAYKPTSDRTSSLTQSSGSSASVVSGDQDSLPSD